MNPAWLLAALPALPLMMTLINFATWRRPRPSVSTPSRWDALAPHLSPCAGEVNPPAVPSVSVLIPARNEAINIEPLLESIRRDQPEIAEILVYDDASSDDTAAIVRRLAGDDPRILLIKGQPLPAGWLGKPHACQRLAEAAKWDSWLFMDADVRLKSGGVGALLHAASESGAAVVSAVPRQVVNSFFERLILPLLHLTYLSWLPLRLVELTLSPRVTAANGQLMFVKRQDYAKMGGFAAIRAELVDDIAFCRRAKAHGLRVSFIDGHHLAECRMYRSGKQIWEGFSKNVYPGLGNSPLALVTALCLYVACFVTPYAALPLALTRFPQWLVPATIGVTSNSLLRMGLAWRYRQPVSGVFWQPLAVLGLIVIALNSAVWVWQKDVRWAGRSYVPRSTGSRRSALFVRLVRPYVRRRLRRQFEAIHIHGLEAVKERAKTGPLLLAANHVAWWDPLLLVAIDEALGTAGHFLMDAKNLEQLAFFAWAGAVPIHLGAARRAHQDLLEAVPLAAAPGQLLVIFPQGRQMPAHLPLQLQRGVAWLAAKTRATVIPVAIRYDFGEGPRPFVSISLGNPVVYTATATFHSELAAALTGELRRIDAMLTNTSDAPSLHGFSPLLTTGPSGRVPSFSRLLSALVGGHHD
ncbi:MAG TPA: glycosyltransferase [Polyangiaceae bacterium]